MIWQGRMRACMLMHALKTQTIIADKAYDAEARVLTPRQKAGKNSVIPPKSNRNRQRDYEKDLYKARHLMENFFAKLKPCRAIATRYDKRSRNLLAAIDLATAVIWLN